MISRLKSLELQGYKTFANRTVFEFPGAVTAIVGPNGSGKSNITDALRWVLGEQSYSLLRGKKTEDMIFAGSERRTRSGMATATVILDNSDNWLPIDYAEVAIQRRAYRDGANEYLLNGQRVRLKDVSELLAESGLAERTYTIIGQGLVDAALALRAEDRRRLFEEAAGIGLHRTRRQEAVRRLEETRRNLERVEDILSELRPRLRSLERQARRAQDYEQAVDELRTLLKDWYGYHWHRAQEELSEAQRVADEQSDQLENSRQKEQELDEETSQLREKRAALREQLSVFHHRSSELHAEREKTSRDLAVSEERARNLQQQTGKLNADLNQAAEELSMLQERCHFADEEVERLKGEHEEAKQRFDSVEGTFASRKAARKALEERATQLQKEVVHLATKKAQLVSQRSEIKLQLDNLEKTLEQTSIASQAARVELDELTAETERLKVQAEQAASKKSNQMQEIEYHRAKVEEKGRDLNALSKQLSRQESEHTNLVTRLEVLRNAEQNYSGYQDGVKLLLDKDSGIKFTNPPEILGSQIEVERIYETAIGAALDEYADALVLKGNNELPQVLDRLAEKKGKAALIPLDRVRLMDSLKDFSGEEGVIGRADQLIRVPEEMQAAVIVLLGGTLVVEDRQTAENLFQRMQDEMVREELPAVSIVTLNGELFLASGVIKTSAKHTPTSLSRPREINTLHSEQEELQASMRDHQREISSLEKEILELKDQEQSLFDKLNKAVREQEKAENAHSQYILQLQQVENESSWREGQLADIERDIEVLRGRLTAADIEYEGIDSQLEQVQQAAEQQQKELNELPFDDLGADLAHWSTRVDILDQTLAESLNRQIQRKQELQVAATRHGSIQSEIEQIDSNQGDLREKIERLKQTNIDIAAELEVSNKAISPTEAELQAIESKLTDLLQLGSKGRVYTSQAEHNFSQARIEQIRKQEALDSLRRQIESDFGLVAFEYREDVTGPTPLPLEGIVQDLPLKTALPTGLDESLKRQRALLRRIGPINPEAQIEYQEVSERFEFLSTQMNDLQQASEDVQQVIAELDEIMQIEFCKTFEAVAEEFHTIFGRLFGGGSARLILTDPDDLTNTGIDIEARLPGRREQGLSLLSGGERSLTAVALVFSLLRVSPTPFCVLDEVDAMLDEANVGRFRELLRELSAMTQFIMITHNRATVQVADIIYGVTMGQDSTSQILSLKVDELEKVIQ